MFNKINVFQNLLGEKIKIEQEKNGPGMLDEKCVNI